MLELVVNVLQRGADQFIFAAKTRPIFTRDLHSNKI
jgi:hypothetical protein